MIDLFAESTVAPSGIDLFIPESQIVSITVPNARMLNEADFSNETQAAYMRLLEKAVSRDGYHAIRVWNFIPGIHDQMEPGRDRYMAFNAGRYQALLGLFGGLDGLYQFAPAATGVGWSGNDLIIHALIAKSTGRSIQNPAQVPPVKYSSRFGPMPPSFSRATAVNDVLFVSGTASISGEESRHIGLLEPQWRLSMEHISSLISSWSARRDESPLDLITDARIYLPDASNYERINRYAEQTFRSGANVEIVRADLCRRELMVEIEVIARESRSK